MIFSQIKLNFELHCACGTIFGCYVAKILQSIPPLLETWTFVIPPPTHTKEQKVNGTPESSWGTLFTPPLFAFRLCECSCCTPNIPEKFAEVLKSAEVFWSLYDAVICAPFVDGSWQNYGGKAKLDIVASILVFLGETIYGRRVKLFFSNFS